MRLLGRFLAAFIAQVAWLNGGTASEVLFHLDFDSGFEAQAGTIGKAIPTNQRHLPTLVEGIKGKAASFGPGQVLRYLSRGNLNKDRGTLSLWVQATVDGIGLGANERYTLFREDGPYTGTDTNAMWAWLRGGVGYRFDLRDPKESYVYFQTAKPWKKGEWHHLAFTWNSARGSGVYVDGRPIAISTPVAWTPKTYEAFLIGAADGEGIHPWGSVIDEVKIFDSELTEIEVRSEYLKFGTSNLEQTHLVDQSLVFEIPQDSGSSVQSKVNVTAIHGVQQITYQKWPESFRISNGSVDVVVVPALGRIMYYGFAGERNVLWENPVLSSAATESGGWVNAGGDKIWPWPQAAWNGGTRGSFTPPPEWDSKPHTVKVTGQYALRMISPVWRGLRVVRDISLAERGTRLVVTSSFEADGGTEDLPTVAPWAVTQMPSAFAVLFHRNSKDPKRGIPFAGASWDTALYPEEDVCLLPKPPANVKIFASGRTLGWWKDDTLFVQQLVSPTVDKDSAWLPYEQLQVYWEVSPLNATTPYIELEFTAPWKQSPFFNPKDPGSTKPASLTVAWELCRLASTRPSMQEVVAAFERFNAQYRN